MWKDFRDFAFKGNVVDLAIGVIIGGVFGKIVTASVNDLIMPLVSLILPSGEWRQAAITLRELPPEGPTNDVRLLVGDLASVIVDFLIVAFVLFWAVRAIKKIQSPSGSQPPAPAPTTRECPMCLEQVPLKAKRCKFCTSDLAAT
ncbi:MAG: large conductance mechanosensitive channel protein MscL [Myxococcales bacterium]